MIRLIGAELFKLRKRAMSRVLLLVLVGIMVILYLLLLAISKVELPQGTAGMEGIGAIENLLGLPIAIPFALSMLASFGTVMAVILVASAMGNEYNWHTIRTMLICSEGRLRLLGAKLVAAGIFILIGMAIGLATGFAMSLITTAIGGYAFDFGFATGSYLWEQCLQFGRTLFVIMPYALLGFLLAIIGRSAMAGIAVGIGVYILESIITTFMVLAGGWIAEVPKYLLTANVNAITALADLPEGFRSGAEAFGNTGQAPGLPHAFITLGVYSLAFLVLAFYLFRKRDVTG